MRAAHLPRLAAIAEDVVSLDDGVLLNVQMGEMGDGSGRSFALVDTYDAVNALEQQYRISSPAPADGAPWTRVFDSWRVEVRTGDSWLELFVEADQDAEVPA